MTHTEKDLQQLFSAIDDADNGNTVPLDRWIKAFGHEEVVLAENVIDSHKGKQLANMGTPLYVAVVLNHAAAVKHLIEANADCNRPHSGHGDTSLLHACQHGYDESLRVLLRCHGMKAASHSTVDRKIFLGQGMPQWEEGGQSALMVAACNGRVETVRQLLQHEEALSLLTATDTFGRTSLQATLDSIAESESERKVADLMNIARQLLEAAGADDVESALAQGIPDQADARERQRQRMQAVRARCLSAERKRKERDRERGLHAISKHYTPLHVEPYSPGAIQSAACTEIAAVTEPFPKVFVFPLLSRAMCCKVWEELHNYEQAACDNPSWELPLRVRHDGNLGDLQDCGFRPLLDVLTEVCSEILARSMPEMGAVEAYHAFVTRNYVGRDENATFKMHCDKSELTLNLCLHASDRFSGSTVGFYQPRAPGEVPGDHDRVFTYQHTVGQAVMHTGDTWHRTDPITHGTRGSLIVWARRKGRAAAE